VVDGLLYSAPLTDRQRDNLHAALMGTSAHKAEEAKAIFVKIQAAIRIYVKVGILNLGENDDDKEWIVMTRRGALKILQEAQAKLAAVADSFYRHPLEDQLEAIERELKAVDHLIKDNPHLRDQSVTSHLQLARGLHGQFPNLAAGVLEMAAKAAEHKKDIEGLGQILQAQLKHGYTQGAEGTKAILEELGNKRKKKHHPPVGPKLILLFVLPLLSITTRASAAEHNVGTLIVGDWWGIVKVVLAGLSFIVLIVGVSMMVVGLYLSVSSPMKLPPSWGGGQPRGLFHMGGEFPPKEKNTLFEIYTQ